VGKFASTRKPIPHGEPETFLVGSLTLLLALVLAVAAAAASGDVRYEAQDARARVLALSKEMAFVARGWAPMERANERARPFGPRRTVSLEGQVIDGILAVEVRKLGKVECDYLERLLKGDGNVGGLLNAVSVNGSEFASVGDFKPEACRPDAVARGSGAGTPVNVVTLRLAADGRP